MTDTRDEHDGTPPLLHVVHGRPTDDEVAALTAVLLARAATAATASRPVRARGGWADRSLLLRPPVNPGRNGWRAAAFPR